MEALLEQALGELCTDLFTAPVPEDANSILHSLASLAEAFPLARTLLGRMLSHREVHQPRPLPGITTKLSILGVRFLYQKETACSAVSLLAALGNSSLRNQRRIVQSIIGTRIVIDPSTRTPVSNNAATVQMLFVLTVPAAIVNAYRHSRKRLRELHGCRIPGGVPPEHNGVPMPCYCDECLGAEQLLPTWQNHFQDLSRWKQNVEGEQQLQKDASQTRTTLSPEAFLSVLLAGYKMTTCSVESEGTEKKQTQATYTSSSREPSLIYYFIPPEEIAAAEMATLPPFNPLYHVSAIILAEEVDVANERNVVPHDSHKRATHKAKEPSDPARSLERVVLSVGKAELEYCISRPAEMPSISKVSNTSSLPRFFTNLEHKYGGLVKRGDLVNHIASDVGDAYSAVGIQLLTSLIGYCQDDDYIPLAAFQRFPHLSCRGLQEVHADTPVLSPREKLKSTYHCTGALVTMTADLQKQALEISCSIDMVRTTGKLSRCFSATIPQCELMATNTAVNSTLQFLRLSDDALGTLLSRCRICLCENLQVHSEADTTINLRPSDWSDQSEDSTLDTKSEVNSSEQIKRTPTCRSTAQPLSGLSGQAKQSLVQLISEISSQKPSASSKETIAAILDKLAKVITNCNERVSFLSLLNDKELIQIAPEAHRAAAIARCRHCRDILIQLGKKLKLQVKSLAVATRSSLEKRQRILQKSISDCLAHSERFDLWEIPDARVEKLNLNQRVWASGFPDTMFYQESVARQRVDKLQQQQLNRRLFVQQQENDSARAKAKVKPRTN